MLQIECSPNYKIIMKLKLVESELTNAKNLLQGYTNNVTIIGSARTSQNDILCLQARKAGKLLSDKGFNVLTGGGPGIMEAANHGAFEGKSASIGFNIDLEHEQSPNPFLDESITFQHFFTRKYSMMHYSSACICFPGGFGTGDELLEILTLIQTKKIQGIDVFLYGVEFWQPLVTWFEELEKIKYVNSDYLESLYILDDINQIVNLIAES